MRQEKTSTNSRNEIMRNYWGRNPILYEARYHMQLAWQKISIYLPTDGSVVKLLFLLLITRDYRREHYRPSDLASKGFAILQV